VTRCSRGRPRRPRTFPLALSTRGAKDGSPFDVTEAVSATSAEHRPVAQLDRHGKFHFTKTNAYSGNNGRAAILNDEPGANVLYTAGNAGNGGNPQPDGIIAGAGAQILDPQQKAEVAQQPGFPTPVGAFDVAQLGLPHDKIGKTRTSAG
jgi:hypothetical protein